GVGGFVRRGPYISRAVDAGARRQRHGNPRLSCSDFAGGWLKAVARHRWIALILYALATRSAPSLGHMRPPCMSCWWRPRLNKNDECDVVRHQQGWHPECRDPVCRPHKWSCLVNGREQDSVDQVQCALDVEQPDQKFRRPRSRRNCRDCDKCERGRQQVSKRCWISELRRHAGIDSARGQKHQTEVS